MIRPQGLTTQQAAIICDVEPSTVRTWIDRGHLHRNEHRRIDPRELLDYIDRRGTIGQRKAARIHQLRRRADPPNPPGIDAGQLR